VGNRTRTLIATALAVALIAWFLRGADLGDVWNEVRAARPLPILFGALLFVPMMAVRAVRWAHLLRPVGQARVGTAFRTTLIGFAVSNVLPARAGEVLRPYLLAREERLSATSAFASIVVERVLDLVAVLTMLAVFLLSGLREASGPAMGAVRTAAIVATVSIIVILVLLMVLASHPDRLAALMLRATRVLPERVSARLSRLTRTFVQGLGAARAPRVLIMATAWSFVLWALIAWQTWLVTTAFGIQLPATGAFLLQAFGVIGVAVPTPGGVGGYHEAFRLGVTTFFGAPNDAAISAALVLHGINFVPTTLVGGVFMVRAGLNIWNLRAAVQPEEVSIAP